MKSMMALIVLLFVTLSEIDVVMNCGSNESISRQWKFKENGFSERILSNELNISRYLSKVKLNTSRLGQYDLHLSQVMLFPAAGTYSCVLHNRPSDKGLQIRRYEAYLEVLTREPKCSTDISGSSYTVKENDVIEAQCSVKYYSVNNNLRMKWMPEDLTNIKATTVTINQTRFYEVTSSITIRVTAQNNALVLSCFTYFTEINESISEDPLLVKATNTPDYNHTCIIPPLNVQYNPRNLTILRQNEDTTELDPCYLCYADGNPPPECRWTITAGETHFAYYGCIFCLVEYLYSVPEIIVECEATNIIGRNMTTIRVNLTANRRDTAKESSNPNGQLTAGVVSISAALVIVIIIAIFCYLRMRLNQMKNNILEGTDNQRSVVQQRGIEMETTEDETTYEYINPGEELPQMGDYTPTYYNLEVHEPKYEGLYQDSIQTSTVYDELSVQQRRIEAQTTEDETTQEYEEELPQMGDGTTNYYNFQVEEPKYLELCEDSNQT